MSLQAKMILPFLDNDITKEDVSSDSGFVNMYMYNKNNPELDEHVFLLYEGTNLTEKNADVFSRFNDMKGLYSFKNVRINDHSYRLYTFSLTSPMLKLLFNKGIPPMHLEDRVKILKFWNVSDEEINKCVLGNRAINVDKTSVPEYDYAESIFTDDA